MSQNLAWICSRITTLLAFVDQNAPSGLVNQRTGATYAPGLPALSETQVADMLRTEWLSHYPGDFRPGGILTQVPYPGLGRASCDLVVSTQGWSAQQHEWAIELKRIQLVGDNGKNNDYGVQKMLSPYLKDRSLFHDLTRLRSHAPAAKRAVIGYAFDYSWSSCQQALHIHPAESLRVGNIRVVCTTNDPTSGVYSSQDLVQAADQFLRAKGLVKGHCVTTFSGLWRHPCGGDGRTFAWEV